MKKGQAAKKELQVELKNQVEWDDLLSPGKHGLYVVDVYAAWCGPCKAIVNTFQKLKNEHGEKLNFALAVGENISSLEMYSGKSRPTFLFYGDGVLINVVRGCNGPLLIRSIEEAIKKEQEIEDGTREREAFTDKEVMQKDDEVEEAKEEEPKEEENEEEEELVIHEKEITVAIIKPDAVEAGLVDEIITQIEATGMEVLAKEERVLTEDEAKEFYKQHEGAEHFPQLIEYMSSGPCMTLIISKAGDTPATGVIPEFRNLIGPTDVNVAKEEAPESLRARFGQDGVKNAIHGCDTQESATRELAFFFPDFNRPTVTTKQKKKRLQRTLALIRPQALAQHREAIIANIHEAGFCIAMEKEVVLTREQVENFYSDHVGQPYFESLVASMISGPSLALCLAREDAVEKWREMLGPKEVPVALEEAPESLRAKFANPEEPDINPIHGADSLSRVEEEMKMLFPVENTVAVIKPDANEDDKEAIIRKIADSGFKVVAQKEVHLTKEVASMFYKEHEGKEFFDSLTDYMSSGPTQFLVLSKEDAISGFRAILGPVDPEEAKEKQPDSLRAQFAKTAVQNAIHASSNLEKAKSVIIEFFPEAELNEDGLIKEPEVVAEPVKEATAAEGESSPIAEGDASTAEGETPTAGGEAPVPPEGETAATDGETPAAEGETPESIKGETSAVEGEAPAEGEISAPAEGEAPTAEVEGSVPVEEETPVAVEGEASAGEDVPASAEGEVPASTSEEVSEAEPPNPAEGETPVADGEVPATVEENAPSSSEGEAPATEGEVPTTVAEVADNAEEGSPAAETEPAAEG